MKEKIRVFLEKQFSSPVPHFEVQILRVLEKATPDQVKRIWPKLARKILDAPTCRCSSSDMCIGGGDRGCPHFGEHPCLGGDAETFCSLSMKSVKCMEVR